MENAVRSNGSSQALESTPACDPRTAAVEDLREMMDDDGHRPLGPTPAAPARFSPGPTTTHLLHGSRNGARDPELAGPGRGCVRTSNPAMVVVRSPSTDVEAAQQ
jgi:hypothetical protein